MKNKSQNNYESTMKRASEAALQREGAGKPEIFHWLSQLAWRCSCT